MSILVTFDQPPPKRFMVGFSICVVAITALFSCFIYDVRHSAKKTASDEYGQCIDRARGIDGLAQDCADAELERLIAATAALDKTSRLQRKSVSFPNGLDEAEWDKYVIDYCNDDIAASTGVMSYNEYGTLDRLMHRMCIVEETRKRLRSMQAYAEATATRR